MGILTLGCRVNQFESEAIAEGFTALGFSLCAFDDVCDIYLIHTCAVTAESERKSRQMIRRALRRRDEGKRAGKKVIVAVVGCYPQRLKNSDDETCFSDGVSYIAGNAKKSRIVKDVVALWENDRKETVVVLSGMADVGYDEMPVSVSRKAKAFVKIEDGCDSFCTYCIVPYLRGRVRSRDKDAILSDVRALLHSGAGEIYLTGIETAAYGAEQRKGLAPFLSLIREVCAIPGLRRLGFGSLKPNVFTEEFVSALSEQKEILPHFHLSIQHGSDTVLKRMRRTYTARDVLDAIDRVRRAIPRVTFSADLIVGFPGESDEEFEEMVEFVKKAGLLHAHIFPYSPREGTVAATFDGQIPKEIKSARVEKLTSVAKDISKNIEKSFDGQTFSLLLETMDEKFVSGHTENNLEMKIPRRPEDREGDVRCVVYHA